MQLQSEKFPTVTKKYSCQILYSNSLSFISKFHSLQLQHCLTPPFIPSSSSSSPHQLHSLPSTSCRFARARRDIWRRICRCRPEIIEIQEVNYGRINESTITSSHHLALAELSIAVSRRYALLVTGLCHSVVQVAHHLNFQVLHELQLLVLAGTKLRHLLLVHYGCFRMILLT